MLPDLIDRVWECDPATDSLLNADDLDRRTLDALQRRGLVRWSADKWTRVEATDAGRRAIEEVDRVRT